MRRKFWKATAISIAAYTTAGLIGFAIDFRLTAVAIPMLLVTWTLFCVVRAVQLRFRGAHRQDAPVFDREDYGFALGGFISSLASLAAVVVLTQ
jgi:hypothetical protein